jgi:uncharacterized protein
MATYRTPDVYVEEISVFPPSVAEVGTAIPAFIGYTERAKKVADDDLKLEPTKIYSLMDFERLFGLPKADEIAVTVTSITADDPVTGKKVVIGYNGEVTPLSLKFLMYFSVKMFFDNGGSQCYIISVGKYNATQKIEDLKKGLDALALEDEPTLIVIPEAVSLSKGDFQTLAQAVLLQCQTLKDRFAIFDIFDGAKDLDPDQRKANRENFGNNYLKYGAAYYPFIKTTMNYYVASDESNVSVTYPSTAAAAPAAPPAGGAGGEGAPAPAPPAGGTTKGTLASLNDPKTLNTTIYNFVKTKLKEHYVTLPPSAAVAGVYAATDAARGVWKAPANVSLTNVIAPAVPLDNARQDELNVDADTGKSINAIRAFAGKGTLVWGARTLAGNDNEWRYVPVRRFFIMVEESVKKSTYWAVFEPNDANTWVKVRGMIENYLIQKWREGALAGATPKDAFYVRCGLGTTMDAQDILEGRMNVEIGMAAVRPAEFIILKFSHKMQTS